MDSMVTAGVPDFQPGTRTYANQTLTTLQKTREMFNLTVNEAHTFYVGQNGWLVYNCLGTQVAYGRKDISVDVKNTVLLTIGWVLIILQYLNTFIMVKLK